MNLIPPMLGEMRAKLSNSQNINYRIEVGI